MGNENGWSDHQMLVLHEIARLSQAVSDLTSAVNGQNIAIESLKLKTGFIATIAGFISAVGFNVSKHFLEK